MKYMLLAFLWAFTIPAVFSQGSLYDDIEFGKRTVNYCDTVIFDAAVEYKQFGYDGPLPLFVQIWFPSRARNATPALKYGELYHEQVPAALSTAYQRLVQQMDAIFIRDGIEYDLNTDELIDYQPLTTSDVLAKIKEIPTRSHRAKMREKLDYPVIVYHHGSQGLSYENSVMAEYFASKGYIFISANFHIPYDQITYGLIPWDLIALRKKDQSSAKALVNFAKSISPGNQVYYVGHSWGAQEGWCFLHEPSWVDGFVSMETTIEFKSDSNKIKEMWPEVYEVIKVKRYPFSLPILVFAAYEESLTFDFFKGVNKGQTVFAAYKEPFAHNSYTSMYLMRYGLRDQINQPDAEMVYTQIAGFAKHLEMMHAFFSSIQKGKAFKAEKFNADFLLE